MLKVVNKRNGAQGVYIGRPSLLGNPFKMSSEADRETVVAQYRKWLLPEIQRDGKVQRAVLKILEDVQQDKEVNLVCWCAPQPCHGDVIKEVIETVLRGEMKL
jgi:hypothetical protein